MKMKWSRRKGKPESAAKAVSETERTLFVSRSILRDTHEYFLPYWRAHVETACFWFGVDAGDYQVVTTIAAPKLYQTSGNYSVEMTSMRRLAAEMRAQGLVNLAQVHTHPSRWVGHSSYDDAHAYSTRDGALSLVWSDYGLQLGHELDGVGVHRRRGGKWLHLDGKEVREKIRLVDAFADFRWEIDRGTINDEE